MMKSYYLEVTHVDALAGDGAADFMTEWVTVEANSEREAMDKTAQRLLSVGRAVTAQERV